MMQGRANCQTLALALALAVALLTPVFSPKNIDRVEQSLTGLSAKLID